MALSLENANLVRQKTKIALAGADPVAQDAFMSLLSYYATQKGNPDLQFVPFSEANADAAGGTAIVDAACQIIGIYVKKTSAATDNYLKLYDDATDDTTAGDQIVAIPLLHLTEEAWEIHVKGLTMGTGVVVTQHTTSIGVTDGSDGGDGFIIIKAA